MKRILSILTMAAFVLSFAACSNADSKNQNNNADNDKLSIVTTIFPEYDWVKQILGDKANNAELTLLLNNGVDLHNYQPTAEDIMKISTCDVFVYVGGESDKWVADALKEAANKNMRVVNLLEALGNSVKEEERIEGMQEDDHNDAHEDEIEYDEHVWLSLRNAKLFVKNIADEIGKADAENADAYTANTDAYIKKLDDLNKKFQTTVDHAKIKTVLFADRFPFRYLTDDYSLKYYAAFSGCSAETEASFDTIIFLADKIDELNLNTVFTIENGEKKIAETVIQNTKSKNQNIAVMNSMQGTKQGDINKGVTYLSIMKENLNALSGALN